MSGVGLLVCCSNDTQGPWRDQVFSLSVPIQFSFCHRDDCEKLLLSIWLIAMEEERRLELQGIQDVRIACTDRLSGESGCSVAARTSNNNVVVALQV